jgi:N-methylhydantoinase B
VHITNTSNLPVESLEHSFPLMVDRYELIQDSGGPGRWRGGMGLRRDVRVLDLEAVFSAHGDRHGLPARGAVGGTSGGCGRYAVDPGGSEERKLPSKVSDVGLAPGSVVRIETPGGGGYGPPDDREPERVLRDCSAGLVSPGQAREIYGVVVPSDDESRSR